MAQGLDFSFHTFLCRSYSGYLPIQLLLELGEILIRTLVEKEIVRSIPRHILVHLPSGLGDLRLGGYQSPEVIGQPVIIPQPSIVVRIEPTHIRPRKPANQRGFTPSNNPSSPFVHLPRKIVGEDPLAESVTYVLRKLDEDPVLNAQFRFSSGNISGQFEPIVAVFLLTLCHCPRYYDASRPASRSAMAPASASHIAVATCVTTALPRYFFCSSCVPTST